MNMSASTRLSSSAPPTLAPPSPSSLDSPSRTIVSDSEVAASISYSSPRTLPGRRPLMENVTESEEYPSNPDKPVAEPFFVTSTQQVRQVSVQYEPPMRVPVLMPYFSQPPMPEQSTQYSSPSSSTHQVSVYQSHSYPHPYSHVPIYTHESYFSYPMATVVPVPSLIPNQPWQLDAPFGGIPGPPSGHVVPPYYQQTAAGSPVHSPALYRPPYGPDLYSYDRQQRQERPFVALFHPKDSSSRPKYQEHAAADDQPSLRLPPPTQLGRSRSDRDEAFPLHHSLPSLLHSVPPMQSSSSSSQTHSHSSGTNIVGNRPRTSSNTTQTHQVTRSEWVMWVGNVPGDASLEELQNFFAEPADPTRASASFSNGVVSIFLMQKSKCAFVNFKEEEFLRSAIRRFNGQPLRSPMVDPGCLKLVCRIRKMIDDPFSMDWKKDVGMQSTQIKNLKDRIYTLEMSNPQSAVDFPPSSPSIYVGQGRESTSLNTSGDPSPENSGNTSGSGSYASSGLNLGPKLFSDRYFILKSLTKHDLDLSVTRGLWATQIHNEPNLNKAYRTTQNVYLIFGVNKSGEFFGYARMNGHISTSGTRRHSIEWASRAPGSGTSSSRTPPPNLTLAQSSLSENIIPEESTEGDQKSPTARQQSVLDITAAGPQNPPTVGEDQISAPVLVSPIQPLDLDQSSGMLFEQLRPNQTADLPIAPLAIPRIKGGARTNNRVSSADQLAIAPEPVSTIDGKFRADGWGSPFKVVWIRTDPLNFHLTKHLKNPWNQFKEVKVSRDGTEIEPSVGRLVLDEWKKSIPYAHSVIASSSLSGSAADPSLFPATTASSSYPQQG